MLFNSYTFLGFYAIVYLAYLASGKRVGTQNVLLLVASYVFYAAWDYRFLGLILLSTGVDYFAARRIDDSQSFTSRKTWLMLSLAVNLGVLATFKYLGFAIESFCQLTGFFGLPLSPTLAEIVLPVGISFYTFQTLSYTIDVYRGRVPACRDLLGFSVYVAFFPQLVAGPIERATHFLPQVLHKRRIRRVDLAIGTQFVVLGCFYKVVLADSVAPMVDQFYVSPSRYGASVAWLANIAFAVQIYGDFAGYSLIARGISRWMGFRLMSNFRQPYLATSPRDFWNRWHRSLSMWLRRYLYFELGGNRFGLAKTCRNLMITMLLGGLWHGASWNFVLWGVYHGALLIGVHAWNACRSTSRSPTHSRSIRAVARVFQIALMFVLTLIGWTLFRCESFMQIRETFSVLFASRFWDPRWISFAIPTLTALSIMLSIDIWREATQSELVFLRAPVIVRWSLYVFMILSVISVGFRPTTFLYFQF
ncbi:MBOAT family O-acyltransferase [Stieleria varia]|uniref:Peptidoglycan O-acetyltransferase n=1 Tax=Stieleria varia TaxID=2528005 RepID=A0A5C6ARN4_9BACT|nr:MBOAT family O-acyltransferase [Stieleria varia]TWU02635.1 Peptidoglycan O-acetyltransferase [Stieleria varia]